MEHDHIWEKEDYPECISDKCRFLDNGDYKVIEGAEHFTNSEEFLNAELSNEAFVEILYRVFFDRVSDEDGMTYWISKLEEDTDRITVLEGFINSMEYI